MERIQSERNGQKNDAGMKNKKNRSIKVPEPVTLDVVEAEQAELWESVATKGWIEKGYILKEW
jgi:hypothetical protein